MPGQDCDYGLFLRPVVVALLEEPELFVKRLVQVHLDFGHLGVFWGMLV